MLCVTDRDFRPGMGTPTPHLCSCPEVPFEVRSLQEPSASSCVFCAAPPDPCRATSEDKEFGSQAPARPHAAASLSGGERRKSSTQALTAIHFGGACSREPCGMGVGAQASPAQWEDGREGKPLWASREASSAKVKGLEAERLSK